MPNDSLPPLTEQDWPPELADMLPGFAGSLNVYKVMAHHPDLLRAWAGLRAHLVTDSALAPQELEVVILRAGHRLGSTYEWAQHILRARATGMDDARIASIKGAVDGMTPGDRMLCVAVDDLFESARLAPATLSALMGTHGKAAVLDLMATVGFYSSLGFMLNTFETPLDDDATKALEIAPLQT